MKTSEKALALCYAIEAAGASEQLTKCSVLASELHHEIVLLQDELTSSEFWREHAERTSHECEKDYLAIWKAVKEPDKTVLESVLALKARIQAVNN